MDPQEVIDLLRRQPFEPFRIHLTDGTVYEVRHPDQCIVTFSAVHVALPKRQASYAAGVAKNALVHVNRLEPIVLEESA
jgi:hypothetical protein